jgi:hypothetical protein
MKLPVLFLATLLAVTGCAADPAETSSRSDRRERAVDRSTPRGGDGSVAPEGSEPVDEPGDAGDPTFAAAVYYLGDTERAGVRLYREFRPGTGDRVAGTLALLMTSPRDPDYRTAWEPGMLEDAAVVGDRIEVVVAPAATERPDGMSTVAARQAVQQVVYSLQAAAQQRLPVQFTTGSGPAGQVLGVPTPGPVRQGSPLQVLSHVSLTSPEQGAAAGDTLRVSGVGNSFEASLGWEIRQAGRVVDSGYATSDGWMEDTLFPFETSVDVSGLEPGSYTLWVTTDDPTSGSEGSGAMTDDREFTVG